MFTSCSIAVEVWFDGRQSLRYLAPYVFRVAIGNHRIKEVQCHADGTGTVTLNMVYMLIVSPPSLPAKRTMSCPDCGGDFGRQ